ncbi:enoyl-CoA-hydratase DpgB [Kitasatospora sp. NPDC006697]|uniref:enoyl-CoA-hydratase DpgB n=1 Tax=Kitasatospora sp. NPDC006697 TaxID=3364020 RepID=UPI003677303A
MPSSPQQLTLDGSRPLTLDTVQALNAFCDAAEDAAHGGDPAEPLVLRLNGAPAGPAAPVLAVVNKWERAVRRLERLERPTVALATGTVGGTALDVLLATDYRIGGTGTRLLPAAAVDGVWPGMALYRLTNQAGVTAARRAVLFGTAIEAGQALALHLLDQLADDPAAVLPAAARALAAAGGSGVGIRRQLMLDASTTSFEEALGRHLAACDRVLRQGTLEVGA